MPSWHDIIFFFRGGIRKTGGVRRLGVITGMICMILAGFVVADYLSTTISTDGSALLDTAGSDRNGSFATTLMATDRVRMNRYVSGGEEMKTGVSVNGTGPVLIDEYAAALGQVPGVADLCRFLTSVQPREVHESSVQVSGILTNAEYEASRTIGPELAAGMGVNGTGMIVFGSMKRDNRSMASRGFVSGNLSVRDIIRYGGMV